MRVSACRLEEKVTFCKLNSDSVRCTNACKCAIRKIEVFLQCIVLDAFRYTLATSECVPLFLPKGRGFESLRARHLPLVIVSVDRVVVPHTSLGPETFVRRSLAAIPVEFLDISSRPGDLSKTSRMTNVRFAPLGTKRPAGTFPGHSRDRRGTHRCEMTNGHRDRSPSLSVRSRSPVVHARADPSR